METRLHICIQDKCDYKAKTASDIKRHLANVHDIGVTWKHCSQEGCDHKTKQASSLKNYLTNIHDIGDNICNICIEPHKSSIAYKDSQGSHKLCRKCHKNTTGKESRVETVWSNYIDKRLGEEYLAGSDCSLKALGGCQRYRPDKIYIGVKMAEIDECDERQHSGVSYSCEEKHISDIYDEEGIIGKNVVVVRLNPHTYKVLKDEHIIKPLKKDIPNQKERFELHIKLKLHLREHYSKLKDKIHIYYLFYSPNNDSLSRNIPYTLIYSVRDFPFYGDLNDVGDTLTCRSSHCI